VAGSAPLCFLVDENVAWLAGPLERRGFRVLRPGRDYPRGASDGYLCWLARSLGCVVVSSDPYFAGAGCGVHLSHRLLWRRNSWEIVTVVVKLAALAGRGRRGSS